MHRPYMAGRRSKAESELIGDTHSVEFTGNSKNILSTRKSLCFWHKLEARQDKKFQVNDMNGWQYLVVPCQNGTAIAPDGQSYPVKQMLNMVGSDGWELVTILPGVPGEFEFVFKRPA